VGRVFIGICLSVCLSVFVHDISKTDAVMSCGKWTGNPFILESTQKVECQGREAQETVLA